MLGVVIVLLAALAALMTSVRRHDPRLVPYAAAGLAMHLLGAGAQLWVHQSFYDHIGDAYTYAEYGKVISRALDLDFFRVAPQVLRMVLHMEANLPFIRLEGGGSGSSSMMALTGALFFLIGSDQLMSFLMVSMIAWGGQLLLAMVTSDLVEDDERPLAYGAALLVPSVVFWSSALVKEGVVLAGLGLLCFSAHRVLALRKFQHVPGAMVGAVLVAMLKPYVLFPFVVGIAGWMLVNRLPKGARVTLRPGPVVLAALLTVGGLLIMSALFPEYGINKLGEHTATQQHAWADADNSSNVDIAAGANTSLASQIPYVPLALVNSLFRPFIFEARNVTSLAAGIETSVLIVLVAQIFSRSRGRKLKDVFLSSAVLSGSTIFVVLFAVAVGLATKNLGSLSRYRMPMIPFYVLAVLLLRRRLSAPPSDLAAEDSDASEETAEELAG